MDVYQCIRSRRTVRDYKPDPIPQEVVRKILQAGRWAPSSSDTQKWRFIVIQDRDTLEALGKIATQGPFIGQAPLAIAVVMDNATRPQLDAGRALQQMELMAWSQGVGMCFVGVREADQQQAVKNLLGIPEGLELITLLPCGYRAEGPKGSGTPRKPMKDIVHWERFGETVKTGQAQHPLISTYGVGSHGPATPRRRLQIINESINGWSPAHHLS